LWRKQQKKNHIICHICGTKHDINTTCPHCRYRW
jgi:primosomal protein N'